MIKFAWGQPGLKFTKNIHDEIIKWKHFPRHWPFVLGIYRSPMNSRNKGQWRGALIFSLICAWINGCINSRKAIDFRRHHAHYDVIVMILVVLWMIRRGLCFVLMTSWKHIIDVLLNQQKLYTNTVEMNYKIHTITLRCSACIQYTAKTYGWIVYKWPTCMYRFEQSSGNSSEAEKEFQPSFLKPSI